MSLRYRLNGTRVGGELLRSAATSALATGTDFLVASSLAASIAPAGLATALGYVAGGLLSFGVNRAWAFRVQGRPGPQLLRFLSVWLSSAALNVAGVVLLVSFLGSRFSFAWAAVRAVVFVGWNFPLLRWFVFPAARAVADRVGPR